jgi:SP family sugar:H+ symporter-like MFS transporter
MIAPLGEYFFGLGRKNCLLLCNILMIIGSIAQNMVFNNVVIFCIGRFLQGLAVGAFSILANKYLSEISPDNYRGSIGGCFQLFCCFG